MKTTWESKGLTISLLGDKSLVYVWIYEIVDIVFRVLSWIAIAATVKYAAQKTHNLTIGTASVILPILISAAVGDRIGRIVVMRCKFNNEVSWPKIILYLLLLMSFVWAIFKPFSSFLDQLIDTLIETWTMSGK